MADFGKMLHAVPLHTFLPASNLSQRCWQAPAFGSSSRLKSSGWSVGGFRIFAPTPRPWPSSVSLRNGAKTRPGPWRRSSAHAATWSGETLGTTRTPQRAHCEYGEDIEVDGDLMPSASANPLQVRTRNGKTAHEQKQERTWTERQGMTNMLRRQDAVQTVNEQLCTWR